MSMLSRYQKPGGFVQLLNLIETCGPQKQEKFLSMIEQEDPRWAEAIKRRMLSMKRILTWDAKYLAELVVRLPELTVGVALHGMSEDDRKRLLCTLSHAQQRRIDEFYTTKKPTPAEIGSTFTKFIEETRLMLKEGYLRADQIDSDLVIDEDIEEKIMSQFNAPRSEPPPAGGPDLSALTAAVTAPNSGVHSQEVTELKRQILHLTKENSTLKTELRKVEEKLAQIRKIA